MEQLRLFLLIYLLQVHHICNCASFSKLSGLRLDPDFVEIPALLMENWCVLNSFPFILSFCIVSLWSYKFEILVPGATKTSPWDWSQAFIRYFHCTFFPFSTVFSKMRHLKYFRYSDLLLFFFPLLFHPRLLLQKMFFWFLRSSSIKTMKIINSHFEEETKEKGLVHLLFYLLILTFMLVEP